MGETFQQKASGAAFRRPSAAGGVSRSGARNCGTKETGVARIITAVPTLPYLRPAPSSSQNHAEGQFSR